MQLELYTPPPESEEPEEAPVTHLGVPEYEKRDNYLTEKRITKIIFELVKKLTKKHPVLSQLNKKQIKK